MFWLKQIKKFIKVLNSNASPAQIAGGIALGSIIGMTPFFSLHNLLVGFIILILNVNISAGLLALAVFTVLSIAIDPLAHWVGYWLLVRVDALTPLWTSLYNMPVVPFSRFNNTILLGSLVIALVSFVPIFLLAKWLVVRYRTAWRGRLEKMRFFKMLGLSKVYGWYRKFIAD